jgi:hypothetical protein
VKVKVLLKSALLRRKLLLPSLAHMASFELPFTRRRFLLLLLFGFPALALPL